MEHATSGRLLGPLLLHPDKKHIDMKLELPTKGERELFTAGTEIIMQIDYE